MSIQKCKSGLYPVHGILHDCPESERKVYKELSKALPQGWYAWYSLKLRTLKNEFAEADFVIADPDRGILILEVKGGYISKEDGHWYQNKKLLKRSPLEQAKRCCNILLKRFKEKEISPPIVAGIPCWPDTLVEKQPTQDDLQGLVIGSNHLLDLHNNLKVVFRKAIRKPRQTQGGWIKELHSMWCDSWSPPMKLSLRTKSIEENLIQLDRIQFDALCSISENDMVTVHGGAGTGKTILACKLAKKEAALGKKVLLLCFTDALGLEISKQFKEKYITASAIGKFAVKLLRDKGYEIKEEYTPEFWDYIPLKAALDGLPSENERWDTVIVDESQDMGENEWELIRECARPKNRIWLFLDNHQAFWDNRKIPDDLIDKSVKYNLNKPYRCPPGIQALVDAYIGGELDVDLIQSAIDDKTIKIIPCDELKVHENVEKEINELIKEGFNSPDIAVISLLGLMRKENIMHKKKLGKHNIVKTTDPSANNNIVCDTFMRFKGLERPAVIITDFIDHKYEIRMNMALSRSLNVLRIIFNESNFQKDQILKKIM